MKCGQLKSIASSRCLGMAAAVIAAIAAVWLLSVYIHACRVLPVEKALVESLKEKARTDAEVQKILQPETDRQHEATVARRNTYRRAGLVLLFASAAFLAWAKWLRQAEAQISAPAANPAASAAPAAVRPKLTVAATPPAANAVVDVMPVDGIIRAEGNRRDSAIPILQAIQTHYRYLPDAALRRVSEATSITPSQLAGVASFYGQFRQRPIGEHVIRVCEGTACHVSGAVEVRNELRRCLGIPEGADTDPAGRFTIEPVACLGSCSLAPVMTVDEKIFGHVSALSAPRILQDFLERGDSAAPSRQRPGPARKPHRGPANQSKGAGGVEIRIGLGSCGIASGAREVHAALEEAVASIGGGTRVKPVGCSGLCHREPLVEIVDGDERILFGNLRPEDVRKIVRKHVRPRGIGAKVRQGLRGTRARLLDDAEWEPIADKKVETGPYISKQVRIVLENCGEIEPLALDEYVARGGMRALRHCIERFAPQDVIEQVRAAGLRGRGGAGFPTAVKWDITRRAAGDLKYVICNGDEGDPGAFMDRAVLEADPYRVVEGLTIAAYAVGAAEGFVYVRREYPIAVRHIREAIRRAEEQGYLGENILGGKFGVKLQVREGAGAFVCGEETALIQSIEGERGMPRLRPPYPAQSGLWGKPTLINNVETLACVPFIVRNGPEAFAALGTAKSKGTKVFSLAGKINRGGLIEVPMGITIREIVHEIGGGIKDGREFKAVLVGGPSGGCIPARLAGTRVDYEELASTGSIMGSGGLVVLDDRDCAVEIARYFLQFTQNESCGKCTFCRIGTKRMLEILERICAGKGIDADLGTLDDLSRAVRQGSLCGLGQTAPNPVLTTMRYFREEYEVHIREKRCPAAQCKALIHFRVLQSCTGCTLCAQACPVQAILPKPYERHEVNDELCTRCGMCVTACPESAIEVA
jgi:NADH-quinone oxidoreductase subunit F